MIQNFTFRVEWYSEKRRPPERSARSLAAESSGSSLPQSPEMWRERARRISSLGILFSAFGVATISPRGNFGCGSSQPTVGCVIESPGVNCEKERKFRLQLKQGSTKPSMWTCLLYTSDAADDLLCVDIGGRRII